MNALVNMDGVFAGNNVVGLDPLLSLGLRHGGETHRKGATKHKGKKKKKRMRTNAQM